MHKKIACLVLLFGMAVACGGDAPPASKVEKWKSSPLPADLPLPALKSAPPAQSGEYLLPLPRLVPSPVPSAPLPLPTAPSLTYGPISGPVDIESLQRELKLLQLARDGLRKGRASLSPSDVRPNVVARSGQPESSLELRLRVTEMLAKLKEIRAKAQQKPVAEPPPNAPPCVFDEDLRGPDTDFSE